MLKFLKYFVVLLLLTSFGFLHQASAQSQEVDYPDEIVVDSDLDGLTDEGEKQIFKTDELNPDSDGDGFLDGAEVFSGFDPLDKTNQKQNNNLSNETPWAWYFVRAAGLISFGLLYFSIFLGLFIRIPFARKIFGPIETMNLHRWLSLQTLFFVFFHGLLMIFDSYYTFSLADVFIPFYSSFNPLWLSLGIIGFYLIIILVVTSYLRGKISNKIWRIVHYFNIILYVFVVAHAYKMGTDLKIEWVRNIFYAINIILIILILLNIFYRIRSNMKRKLKLENDSK